MTSARLIRQFVMPALCGTLLAGCTGAPSNVEPPAELKSFNRTLSARVLWDSSLGASTVPGARTSAGAEDGKIIYAGGNGKVLALDPDNGRKIWVSQFAGKFGSGVAAGDGIAVVTTRNGAAIGFSLADGSNLWTANFNGEVLSVPAIGGGRVIVQTTDGRVIALAATSGKQLWDYERTIPALSLRGNSGAVYKEGLVVAGFASGHIVGIDASNGRVIWERVVAYPSGRSDVERLVDVDSPPVISGFYLFAASYQGQLVAIDLRNGQTVWSKSMSTYLPMVADSRNLYVVNDRGVILALDQATGANRWIQNDLERRISSGLELQDQVLVAGDIEGYIHLLNSSDGKIAGRLGVGSGAVMSHLALQNTIYSITANGKLVAFRIKSL